MLNEEIGYDRHQYVKRAYAFEHIIFPSCARRIILQREYGYGYMVSHTMNGTLKIFKAFLVKVRKDKNAKAYFICMRAFYNFLILINYPIPETNEMLLLLEENEHA